MHLEQSKLLLCDLTGVALPCMELTPVSHPRNIPISRPLMKTSRVYVNPATGVSPNAHDLIPFVTLLLTPKAVAVPGDDVARTNLSVWRTFGQREGHHQERSSMPTVAALQWGNGSRSSNTSSSNTTSTSSGSSPASASSTHSSGWLKRRPRLARRLDYIQ